MPKKKKSKRNSNKMKKSNTIGNSIQDQIENINKEAKKGKIAKSFLQFFKGLAQGTVNNAKNAFNTISQIPDMDLPEFGAQLVKGGKQYVESNINSIKDIIGIIKAFNHPEWYTKYNLATTNLNFGATNYSKYRANDIYVTGAFVPTILSIPGTLTQRVAVIPGAPTSKKEDVNVADWRAAIQFLYASLGGSNSSLFPFELEDLEGYILNVRGLMARAYYLAQVLTTLNQFEIEDGNSPMPGLYALGASTTYKEVPDVVTSRAYCIDKLNFIFTQMSALLPIIPELTLFDRTAWLFGNTFLDDADIYKATEINFIPEGFDRVVYNEPGAPRTLKRYMWSKLDSVKLDDAIDELADVVGAVCNYPQTSMISSYILKAYGDSAWMAFPVLTTSSCRNAVYDAQLLKQFANATTFGGAGQVTTDISVGYSWGRSPILTYEDFPNYQITCGDNVPAATKMGPDLTTIISSEDPDVSGGKVYSLTAMNGGYRPLVIEGEKLLYFVGCIRGTEILYAPVSIYSTQQGNEVQYFRSVRTQLMGEWYYSALDAILNAQIDGLPAVHTIYNLVPGTEPDIWVDNYAQGTTPWCNYLQELDIYAYAHSSDLEAFNRNRVLSMLKSIPIQDQNNYITTKRNK